MYTYNKCTCDMRALTAMPHTLATFTVITFISMCVSVLEYGLAATHLHARESKQHFVVMPVGGIVWFAFA